MAEPLILFALVAKFEDQPEFLWTTPSVLRQPHEHAREVYERNAPGRYALRIARFVEVKEGA